MIPFPFNENRFSFFVAGHLLVGQLCTNPKSDRSLLSCLKVTQCSANKIGNEPLYNPCSLPIQVMTATTIAGLPRIAGTYPGWWKQSFWLRLWSLVWFQVRATSCHLTSSKSAWKSTPKCSWMYWSVLWSSAADSGCGSRTWHRPTSERDPGLASEWVLRLCTLLSLAPSFSDLNPLDYIVWSYVENITNTTSHTTKASLIAAICRVFA